MSRLDLALRGGGVFGGPVSKTFVAMISGAVGVATSGAEQETCGDGWLILELPAKLAAARQSAAGRWDSGVTLKMKESTSQHNDAPKEMIMELGKTYYAKPPTAQQVDELEKALVTEALFAQDAGNPRGEPLGTIAPLEVASEAGKGLEETIVRMVKALIGEDGHYSFAEWKMNWDKALAGPSTE